VPSVKIKIQLIGNDNIAMGPGKADLLEAIQHKGSISSAALSMDMSYKRAWDLVNVMNKSFKQALIATSVGGDKGGGAQVTEFGLQVLTQYRAIEAKASLAVKNETKGLMQMLIDK
jgi:molybdate transport system regulatory protein